MMWLIGKIRRDPLRGDGRNYGRGFTLVELLIVVLLLAVLAAASLPALAQSARAMVFRSEIRRLEALLRYVQRKAVLEERRYVVTFEPLHKSYAVSRDDQQETFWPVPPIADNLMSVHRLPASFSLADENSENSLSSRQTFVGFSPQGFATPAKLSLADAGGRRALFLISLSGEIFVEVEGEE